MICQVKVEFSTLNDPNLFSSIYDTGSLILEEYYEKTGVLKEEFFYGESFKVDSLKRYYENGSLAYFGVILDKVEVFSKWTFNNIAFAFKTYETTYYENGCKRSISFEDNTNEKKSRFLCLFDENTNEIVYRNEVVAEEIISGVDKQNKGEGDSWLLTIFRNGKAEEKWYVSDFKFSDSTNTFMLDRIEFSDSTIISKRRKLKRHLRKKNILYWKTEFLIW